MTYSCMPWHTSADEFEGIRGSDLLSQGIPSQREYLSHYQRCSGRTDSVQPFHLAFSLFRFAVILEGIAARARSGIAAATDAVRVGAQSAAFARRAVGVIDGDAALV